VRARQPRVRVFWRDSESLVCDFECRGQVLSDDFFAQTRQPILALLRPQRHRIQQNESCEECADVRAV
jgi:hypothetical protein